MGGYGGALKQLSIGCASRAGKALIHSAGKTDDRFETWRQHASSVVFPEAMADAASSVVEHFQGKIAYINVMKNLSVDCDCCAVADAFEFHSRFQIFHSHNIRSQHGSG